MLYRTVPGSRFRHLFLTGLFLTLSTLTLHAQTWVTANGLTSWGDIQAILPSGKSLLVGTQFSGVYRTPNAEGPYTWTSANNGMTISDQTQVTSLIGYKDYIFAGTSEGAYRSQDNGTSWSKVNIGLKKSFIYAFANIGEYLIVASAEGISRSSDNGLTWAKSNKGLADSLVIRYFVSDGDYLFVGALSGIFRSANYGTTWSRINKGLADSTSIRSLAGSDGNILVGTVNGVYRSMNYGDNWAKSNSGLGNQIARCFTILGSEVFTGINDANGSKGGVLHSTNDGLTWSAYGLTGHAIKSFTVSGEYIFAGADEGRLNKLKLPPGTVSIRPSRKTTIEFSSPRNLGMSNRPGSRIEFGVPSQTLSGLILYDAKGIIHTAH